MTLISPRSSDRFSSTSGVLRVRDSRRLRRLRVGVGVLPLLWAMASALDPSIDAPLSCLVMIVALGTGPLLWQIVSRLNPAGLIITVGEGAGGTAGRRASGDVVPSVFPLDFPLVCPPVFQPPALQQPGSSVPERDGQEADRATILALRVVASFRSALWLEVDRWPDAPTQYAGDRLSWHPALTPPARWLRRSGRRSLLLLSDALDDPSWRRLRLSLAVELPLGLVVDHPARAGYSTVSRASMSVSG